MALADCTVAALLVVGVFLVTPRGSQASGRETINFDFAWRFHLGDLSPAATCPPNAFPKNLTGQRCSGLHHTLANSPEECMNDCCADEECAIWQFASPASQETHGCWIGQSDQCSKGDWESGERTLPAPTPPPATTGPTSRGYDDSKWELVDVPHDAIVSGTYSQGASASHGYLPFNVTWYRKHFNLPTDWQFQAGIWVYFEGVFRGATVYFNGEELVQHDSGYTSFRVRLDNAKSIFYGNGSENINVIVVRAHADGGSGWWYEGGGIYRHTYLVKSNTKVHFVTDGVYAGSNVSASQIQAHNPNDIGAGLFADSAMVYPIMNIVSDFVGASMHIYMVNFTIFDADGKQVASGKSDTWPLDGGAGHLASLNASIENAELWSSARPYLYTMQAQIVETAPMAMITDEVNVSFGIRDAKWTADKGFFLNGEPFTWRGFCDHNDFTGVGVAVPDRVNLFRAQTLRGVGGNSWRMSHNPPIPALLDILDRVGVVVWDENRQFGLKDPEWAVNQYDMVMRDRNHSSVIIWSFCNEGGCNPSDAEEAGEKFKQVSNEADPFRLVTGNMIGNFGQGLSKVIDVQGFSHKSGSVFDDFHKQYPTKPTIGSECCSCRTQRGEDVADSKKPNFGNFNADCAESQNGAMLWRPFVSGSLVWTLFDYYGEPTPYRWPMVSSSFGSVDLAGFPKAAAYWYRAWWLYNTTNTTSLRSDLPYNPPQLFIDIDDAETGFLAHVVQHWESDVGGDTRTVQGYTNAPMADLIVNGKSQGVVPITWMGWAEWKNVQFAAGNITMVAMTAPSHIVATHTVLTPGKPVAIKLTIDAPSEMTGTGTALVLDGQDAGLVRASILDSAGNVVNTASNNVTFSISSGPGRIIGVGNGDPTCHEPNKATWRSAYHGLARVIVQTTKDSASPANHRRRLLEIDADGGQRTTITPPGEEKSILDNSIVVQATAEGLTSGSVSIPVSTDMSRHGVLASAEDWMKRRA